MESKFIKIITSVLKQFGCGTGGGACSKSCSWGGGDLQEVELRGADLE